MMPQAMALTSTCFTCLVFDNLAERFIGVVLEALSQDLQLPIADQCLVAQTREHRIIEKRFDPV
jgi:hypothetical protein